MGRFSSAHRVTFLLVVLASLSSFANTNAQKVFTPGAGIDETYLGTYLGVLYDEDGQYSLQEVMERSDEMVPSAVGMPSLGFRQGSVWFHLSLNTDGLDGAQGQWMIDYAFLDEVKIFQVVDGKVEREITTGDSLDFNERPVLSEWFIIPLELPSSGIVEFYFRIASTESLIFPLRFVPDLERGDLLMQRMYLFGGLFGAMALIVVYNLCLSLILRDGAYVLYWIYLMMQSVFQFIYSGHAFRFWWPDSPGFQVPAVVFGGLLVTISAMEFSRSYLKTREVPGLIDRILHRLGWFSVTAVILAYLVGEQEALAVVSGVSFIVPLAFLVASCLLYRDNHSASALYFIIAFAVLILGYCYTGAAALGVFNFTSLAMFILPVAVVLEGTLLSLGLAHRIRSLQQEKATTLELLLEQSTHAARLGLSAQRFVPHQFLESLGHSNISEVRLGDSVSSEMTVLFSDIRDFTRLSEGMSPEENFEFVNEYLQVVTPVIYEHGGFVDKYIGDAVMALFPGDPSHACKCALEIQSRIEAFNLGRGQRGLEPLRAGIGIHTGRVMLGTVGDKERLQTTVISDAVNFASRIEGLTKEYRVPILVSQALVNGVGAREELFFETMGTVDIKGKSQEATIYSLKDG